MLSKASIKTGMLLALSYHKNQESRLSFYQNSLVHDLYLSNNVLFHRIAIPTQDMTNPEEFNNVDLDDLVSSIYEACDQELVEGTDFQESILVEYAQVLGSKLGQNLEFNKEIVLPIVKEFMDDCQRDIDAVVFGTPDTLIDILVVPTTDYCEMIDISSFNQEHGPIDFTLTNSFVRSFIEAGHFHESGPLFHVTQELTRICSKEKSAADLLDNFPPSPEDPERLVKLAAYHILFVNLCSANELVAGRTLEENTLWAEENLAFTSKRLAEEYLLYKGYRSVISHLTPGIDSLSIRPTQEGKLKIYLTKETYNELTDMGISQVDIHLAVLGLILSDLPISSLTVKMFAHEEYIPNLYRIGQNYLTDINTDKTLWKKRMIKSIVENFDKIHRKYEDEILFIHPGHNHNSVRSNLSDTLNHMADLGPDSIEAIAVRYIGGWLFGNVSAGELLSLITHSEDQKDVSYCVHKYLANYVCEFLNQQFYTEGN